MVFDGENGAVKNGFFRFGEKAEATAHRVLDNATVQELWQGCCFRRSALQMTATEALVFKIGEARALDCTGAEYAISVEEGGACVTANGEEGLIRGFATLAQRVRTDDDGRLQIRCCQIKESPLIERRMAHFCVFPETTLWEIERFVRFCGALKYSHLILEFWGTLRYDGLKELSWANAFTKEQIRPIIKQANELGMEIIPMFNHWGHASAGRVKYGKHVVLDQNPSLQYFFDETGWVWNIRNSKTKALLKTIRDELIELCGEGEYFHIGCDEAYGFSFEQEAMQEFCVFVNEITAELAAVGRRPLAWGDMLLSKRAEFNPKNRYYASAPSDEKAEYLLSRLDKRIVIADWQYESPEYPVETAAIFQNAGFDVILCPWDRGIQKSDACIRTVKTQKLYGIMHTTWHTLTTGYPYLLYTAEACWQTPTANRSVLSTNTAALLRKVFFADGEYTKAGWSPRQIQTLE